MSCCTNDATACIFGNNVTLPAARVFTSCLIGSDAFPRSLVRFPYQLPILSQFTNSFFCDVPPDGKNDTIIFPATPLRGGMSGSDLIPLTSPTAHCNTLPLPSPGFTSAWKSQEDLKSQPEGSCSE